eukprot:436637_1
MANQLLDSDSNDGTDLAKILKANDLYDHLFDVLQKHAINYNDLVELGSNNDDVNDLCQDINISGMKKMKFKRLIRIITQTRTENKMQYEEKQQYAADEQLQSFLTKNKLPLNFYDILIQQEIGYEQLSLITPYNIDTLCKDNNVKIGVQIKFKQVVEEYQFELLKNRERSDVTPDGNIKKKEKLIQDPKLKELAVNNKMSTNLYNALVREGLNLKLLGLLTQKGIDNIYEKNNLNEGAQFELQDTVAKIQRKQKCDHQVEMVVIGDSNVGKSCLCKRYVRGTFQNLGSTFGIDQMYAIQRTDDGTMVKIRLVDTAGQERYYHIVKNVWRRAELILMCYSMDNEEHLQSICGKWLDRVKEYASDDVIVMLIGTKLDLNNRPGTLEITEVEKTIKQQPQWDSYQPTIMECSALTGYNVENVFKTATQLILKKRKQRVASTSQAIQLDQVINNNNQNINRAGGGCCD